MNQIKTNKYNINNNKRIYETIQSNSLSSKAPRSIKTLVGIRKKNIKKHEHNKHENKLYKKNNINTIHDNKETQQDTLETHGCKYKGRRNIKGNKKINECYDQISLVTHHLPKDN